MAPYLRKVIWEKKGGGGGGCLELQISKNSAQIYSV